MENEHAERSGCGQYVKRIFICVCKKNTFVFLFCIDDNVET